MYSWSGTPLTSLVPVRYVNAGRGGLVGLMRLTLLPQARAHSRRSFAVVGSSESAAQRICRMGVACAAVGWKNVPAPATAREARVALALNCIACVLWRVRQRTHIRCVWWHPK